MFNILVMISLILYVHQTAGDDLAGWPGLMLCNRLDLWKDYLDDIMAAAATRFLDQKVKAVGASHPTRFRIGHCGTAQGDRAPHTGFSKGQTEAQGTPTYRRGQ